MQPAIPPESAPVEVTRVEWVPATPDEVLVRVVGRRRAASSGGVVLRAGGVSVEGREEPSVDPGEWRAAFSLPAELRPALIVGDAVLVADGVELALPPAAAGALASAPAAEVIDHARLAERRARRAEGGPGADEAGRLVGTLEAQLANLEDRIARETAERQRLAAELAARKRDLRAASQRSHAEERLRIEAEDERDALRRELEARVAGLRERAVAAEERAAVLEREARDLRHALVEARAGGDDVTEDLRAELTALRDELRRAAERRAPDAPSAAAPPPSAAAPWPAPSSLTPPADPARLLAAQQALAGLAGTAAQLRERLAAIERGRGRADADLASARDLAERRAAELAAVHRALQRAEAERDAARGDAAIRAAELADAHRRIAELLAERDELERQAADLGAQLAERARLAREVGGLREELDRARAQVGGRTGRDSALEALVAEVVHTAEELRARFDRDVAAVVDELRARSEHLRAQVDGLRAEADALRARLAEERAARAAAEAALEAERRRADDLARRADEAEARARDPQTRARIVDLGEAAQRLRDRTEARPPESDEPAPVTPFPPDGEDRPEPPGPSEPGPMPASPEAGEASEARDHEDGGEVGPSEPGATHGPPSNPFDAARAALRAAADAAAAAEAAADAAKRGAGEAGGVAAEKPAAPARERAPIAEILGPRVLHDRRGERDWLGPALGRLADADPERAAHLLVSLLPDQARTADRDLVYDLTIDELAETHRVALRCGVATIRRVPAAPTEEDRERLPGEPDVRIAGRAAKLAPLGAGGAPRRLRDVRVDGPRRRLRRLLKQRRRPVSLAHLANAGSRIDPGLVLAVLAAAVDADWTAGHDFAVDVEVQGRGAWRLVAADGSALRVSAPRDDDPEAAATIRVSDAAFLPLLARVAPPPGEQATVAGHPHAAHVLLGWFDRAQGLPARR